MIYSSYFGGNDDERVGGYGLLIRTDDSNNFYLCGSTRSTDSIATDDAYQTVLAGGYDVFIAKFADTVIVNAVTTQKSESLLEIYPNPVHGFVTINFEIKRRSSATLKICSAEGKVVMKQNIFLNEGKNEIQFSVQNLNRGMYIAWLNDSQSLSFGKFIVE